MQRSEVFCSVNVLINFLEQYLLNLTSDEEESNIELSIKWYKLLSKYSELVLDISQEQAEELSKKNIMFLKLVKASQRGGSRLIFEENFYHSFEKDNRFNDFISAIYLKDQNDEECKKFEDSFGQIMLNNNGMFSKGWFLFNPITYNISKRQNKKFPISWDNLKAVSHPFNSMIITDNFLLKEKDDIEFNVIPMLNALLPEKLTNTIFQLSIFTYSENINILITRLELLNNLINIKLQRDYPIEVSIIPISSKEHNHDRCILTNYCYLQSGHSLSYFKKDGSVKKDTNLFCFPIFSRYQENSGYNSSIGVPNSSTVLELAYDFINRMKNIKENHSSPDIGDCNNRMLV